MTDRKLDEVTLAVFGDHDAGYGQTYSELAGEDEYQDWLADENVRDIEDFSFGDPLKRPAKPK